MRSLIAFIFLVTLMPLDGDAQSTCEQRISGSVIDEHDESFLDGAAVYFIQSGQGSYTSGGGAFTIDGLCPGLDTLRVSHIGCETVFIPVVISEASAKTLLVKLEHHAESLSTIDVHAHRNQTSVSDIGATLSGDQLDRTAGDDFINVIEALPGVRSVNSGANVGRPLIDGLGGARIQVVQGGFALSSQDWGDEHALEIDPFGAANLQLARGGAALKYGASRTGGSIVVDDPSIPENKKINGQTLLNASSNTQGLGAGVSLNQRTSKHWGYRLDGYATSHADAQAANYILSNTGSRRASGQARVYYTDSGLDLDVSYRFFGNETGILRAAHIGNLTDLERALQSDEPLIIKPRTRSIDAPRQSSLHHWLAANGTYHFANDQALVLSFSYQVNQRKEYDIRRGGRSAIPSIDLELTTSDIRAEYQWNKAFKHRPSVGLHAQTMSNRNDPNTGTAAFIPYYDRERVGLYAMDKLVKNATTYEFVLRGDLEYTLAQWAVREPDGQFRIDTWDILNPLGSAAVGLSHHFSPKTSLRSQLAFATRTPNPAERFADGVHHALAVIERGDTTLKTEVGLKFLAGLSHEFNTGYEVHVGAFFHQFQNYIFQQRLAEPELTVRGAFPVVEYQQGDAMLAGFDVDGHASFGQFSLDQQFSYIYGALSSGEVLPDVAPWQSITSLTYNQTTNGRLKDWSIGSSFTLVGRQNRAPEVLPREAPEGYGLVSLVLGGHLVVGGQTLGIHCTASNLLNTDYREYLDRLRYYAARPGRDVRVRLLYNFQ